MAFWLAFLRQITWCFCGKGGVEEGIEGDGWQSWRGKCGRMAKSEQGRARDDGKGLSLRVGMLRDANENASEGRIYIIRYKVRFEEDDDSRRWE